LVFEFNTGGSWVVARGKDDFADGSSSEDWD
jgi:hypothetical protein